MTIPVKREITPAPSTIEDVLISGDLSKLTPAQRTEYYMRTCQSLGLNPMTRPFDYLMLNNKLTLYARRDAADQLRKINGIGIEIISQEMKNGLLTVHVRAKDRDGRTDEDVGVVAFSENLKGDAAANTIMKAVTKAKRRVTLSISGLGLLDETEVADISAGKQAETIERVAHDPETGEIGPHALPLPKGENDSTDWIEFGATLLSCVRSSADKVEADLWLKENAEAMKQCAIEMPKVSSRLTSAIRSAGQEMTGDRT